MGLLMEEENLPINENFVETEVKEPNVLFRMPKNISQAINKIIFDIEMLGKDGKNEFQKYDYASIDKFLSTLNPLMAKHGLIIMQDEETCKIITYTKGRPLLNIV